MLLGSCTFTWPVEPDSITPSAWSSVGLIAWSNDVPITNERLVLVKVLALINIFPPDSMSADRLTIEFAWMALLLPSIPPARVTAPKPRMVVDGALSVLDISSEFSMAGASKLKLPAVSVAPIKALGPVLRICVPALSKILGATIFPELTIERWAWRWIREPEPKAPSLLISVAATERLPGVARSNWLLKAPAVLIFKFLLACNFPCGEKSDCNWISKFPWLEMELLGLVLKPLAEITASPSETIDPLFCRLPTAWMDCDPVA